VAVPTKKDNDDERFARIDALMEEYRVSHEDFEHYLKAVQTDVRAGRDRARQNIARLKKQMDTARRLIKKFKGK
jgi:hypothetical protein